MIHDDTLVDLQSDNVLNSSEGGKIDKLSNPAYSGQSFECKYLKIVNCASHSFITCKFPHLKTLHIDYAHIHCFVSCRFPSLTKVVVNEYNNHVFLLCYFNSIGFRSLESGCHYGSNVVSEFLEESQHQTIGGEKILIHEEYSGEQSEQALEYKQMCETILTGHHRILKQPMSCASSLINSYESDPGLYQQNSSSELKHTAELTSSEIRLEHKPSLIVSSDKIRLSSTEIEDSIHKLLSSAMDTIRKIPDGSQPPNTPVDVSTDIDQKVGSSETNLNNISTISLRHILDPQSENVSKDNYEDTSGNNLDDTSRDNILPTNSEDILPTNSEDILPTNSEVILPNNSEVILPTDSEVILPTNSEVILPTDSEDKSNNTHDLTNSLDDTTFVLLSNGVDDKLRESANLQSNNNILDDNDSSDECSSTHSELSALSDVEEEYNRSYIDRYTVPPLDIWSNISPPSNTMMIDTNANSTSMTSSLTSSIPNFELTSVRRTSSFERFIEGFCEWFNTSGDIISEDDDTLSRIIHTYD